MKKIAVITLHDNISSVDFLFKFPPYVSKDQVEQIIRDISHGNLSKYNLPEDWTYDEVAEVIAKELGGEILYPYRWEFYL
ncbi:MAG: hypothetical protein DRI33_03230 [Caldiserica bacterium]|nr:MAG: hypothetical protein DRI33_03230 [Caldisericota bacterium]